MKGEPVPLHRLLGLEVDLPPQFFVVVSLVSGLPAIWFLGNGELREVTWRRLKRSVVGEDMCGKAGMCHPFHLECAAVGGGGVGSNWKRRDVGGEMMRQEVVE